MTRALLLMRKADSDEVIDQWRDYVSDNCTKLFGQAGVEIETSRDAFLRMASSIGGFAGWEHEVVYGRNAQNEPNWHVYLVVNARVGSVTARIVEKLIAINKPVLVYNEGGDVFHRATSLTCVDSKNKQAGWLVS